MSATLKSRRVNGIVIIDISGRLCAGDPALQLRQTLRRLMDDGNKYLLLNLSGVHFVDTSALGVMVTAYANVRRDGGDIKLLHLMNRVKDLLVIAKLLSVFEVFDDEVEAVRSFEMEIVSA